MKAAIHPAYEEINVICACGSTFKTRSTHKGDIRVEICSSCHPFFTGRQKLVDTEGRVDRFQKKMAKSKDLKDRKELKDKKLPFCQAFFAEGFVLGKLLRCQDHAYTREVFFPDLPDFFILALACLAESAFCFIQDGSQFSYLIVAQTKARAAFINIVTPELALGGRRIYSARGGRIVSAVSKGAHHRSADKHQ
jgi:large subunit ribosomal protein L31